MAKPVFNWKREKKPCWFNFKIFKWKSKPLWTVTVLGVVENRVSRFFHVYILCFMELQRQVKTGELWSGGALELKCPGFEAVLKHQVWNSPPRFCRVEGTEGKLLWGKSYAPFMNPSLIDGQKRIFWRENFNKLFYHTYPTSQTGIHSKAYNKQHLHQEVAIQI